MPPTFDLITSHTFGAGEAEVEFTSISQSYSHLYVYFTGGATAAASTDVELKMIPNDGDWSGNLVNYALGFTGNLDASSGINNYSTSAATDYAKIGDRIPGASTLSWGALKLMLYDYSVAGKKKSWKSWGNHVTDYTYTWLGGGAGAISETDAIDAIKFYITSGDFVSGTMIRIYGLANS